MARQRLIGLLMACLLLCAGPAASARRLGPGKPAEPESSAGPVHVHGRALQSSSPTLRDMANLALGVGGAIPIVGPGVGVLGALANFFWQEDSNTPEAVFNSIKDQVAGMIKGYLDEAKVESLMTAVAGLKLQMDDFRSYNWTTSVKANAPKTAALEGLRTLLNEHEPEFMSTAAQPGLAFRMLPIFVSFGSLKMAALRETVVNYNKMYGKNNPNYPTDLKKLTDARDRYTSAFNAAYGALMDWRQDQFSYTFDEGPPNQDGGFYALTTHTARDAVTGWTYQKQDYVTCNGGDDCQGNDPEIRMHASEPAVRAALKAKLAETMAELRRSLQDARAIAGMWAHMANVNATYPPPPAPNKDWVLTDDQDAFSPSRNYRLLLHGSKSDGNLVLLYSGPTITRPFFTLPTGFPVWASMANPGAPGPYRLVLQASDANLVQYSSRGPYWASNSARSPYAPYRLAVQDDANLVVYDRFGSVLWARDYRCHYTNQ